MTAAHCEVKLHAFRRTADGTVVSFLIHPSDTPNCLALDPLGTRYMLAVAQIGDDEQISKGVPLPPATAVVPERAENRDTPHGQSLGAHTDDALVDYDLALGNGSEHPVRDTRKSERAKTAYANATLGEQAVIRAALLAKDETFQRWVHPASKGMPPEIAEQMCGGHIRGQCGIASRSELATNPDAFERFLKMEAQYRLDTGALPEVRG